MYLYSKKSGRKVVHKDNCYHLREAQREDIGWFHTLEEAQAAGAEEQAGAQGEQGAEGQEQPEKKYTDAEAV